MTRDERDFLQKMIASKVGDILAYQQKSLIKSCSINSVSIDDVLSRSRVKNIILCRTMYFAFCREVLHLKYNVIGVNNNYQHSSVVNLVNKHNNYISYDLNYINQYQILLDWHKQNLKNYDKD